MVSYDKNTRNLSIPSALGNFQGSAGGGMTPTQVQEMINSSITVYNETVQEEFNTTNSGVSENAENIETLSGKTAEIISSLDNYATTATTSGLSSDIQDLSGKTGEIINSLDNYATTAVTSAITESVQELSGATQEIENNFGNYATTAVTEELSGVTSGIAADLQTLSAYTETIPTGISSTVKYMTEDTWPGATWDMQGVDNKWGASITYNGTKLFETYQRSSEYKIMGQDNFGNPSSTEGAFNINDENQHLAFDQLGNRYIFQMDFTNGILYFYHSPEQTGTWVYAGAQGRTYTTGATTGTVYIEQVKVLSGDTWIQKDEALFPKFYFLETMSDAERQALFNFIRNSGPKFPPAAKFGRYFGKVTDKDGFMGDVELYFSRFENSGSRLVFTGDIQSRNSEEVYRVRISLNSNGSIDREQSEAKMLEYTKVAEFSFTPSTSAWTSSNFEKYYAYSSWNNAGLYYARIYYDEVYKKVATGCLMSFSHYNDDEMYDNFYIRFNYTDLDGVEWKVKLLYDNQSDPNISLVSMTQV